MERHGPQGYVVVASTGESVMLGTDEKIQLWEWVAQWAAPEKLLIAGTGMDSVHQTVALTNRAADIGYKAALVKTPSFFKGQFAKPETQMLYLPRRGRSSQDSGAALQLSAEHGHRSGG